MERGRSTGGGARGLVAGVRAVFRSRSCSEKHSRSGSLKQVSSHPPGSRATHPPARNNNNNNNNNKDNNSNAKSHRSPKSPFLGWRRSKSHKDVSETQRKARWRDGQDSERAGWCSQSQAERLSLHSSEDYVHATVAQGNARAGHCEGSKTHQPLAGPGDSNGSDVGECRRTHSDMKSVNETNTNASESRGDFKYTKLQQCNGEVVCSDSSSAVDNGGETCAKTSSVKDHDSVSANCDSKNVEVSSDSSCEMWAESESGEQPGDVVRDRGDGSDALEVCGEDKQLENEACVRYFRDMYRNSKQSFDRATSFRGGPVVLGRGLWLKAALSYNLRVPDSPRNEVVVLALGIDQYIEEVFGYLDHSGTSKVNVEDFQAVCQILGLMEDEEEGAGVQKCQCFGSNLTLHGSLNGSLVDINKFTDSNCPLHLSFSDFHDKLCARFISAAKAESVLPLGLRRPNNPRLVTSVVNVQRRYDVLESISRSLAEVNAKLENKQEAQLIDECPTTGVVCCKCQQMAHVDRNSNISPQPLHAEVSYLQRQVLLQEQELQCLREVIEDMRIALQSSDAENLALQVKIKRGEPCQRASQQDFSLTDEEDTIDNLVRQLTDLDRPAARLATLTGPPRPPPPQQQLTPQNPERSGSPENLLNTAFVSGDLSMEAELQATYEALQVAREEQEAMQADLQKTVSQLQEREADLKATELNLRAAHSALEKAHYDNHALVMEIAETRRTLEESRTRLQEAWGDLRQARDTALLKETQLQEAQTKLQRLRHSRERVVRKVTAARALVAGSLGQVRASEQALHALSHGHDGFRPTHNSSHTTHDGSHTTHNSSSHTTHDGSHTTHKGSHTPHAALNPSYSPPTSTKKLDVTCRTDSGLYSEDSERDDDMKTPDRSTDHISVSEDDLWTPRLSGSDPNKDNLISLTRGGKGGDSSSSSSLKSHFSSPQELELIIIEEGDLPQQSSSSKDREMTQYKKSSPKQWDLTQWGGKSLGDTFISTSSSTAIIEGLEREVQWLQLTLDQAEKECEENLSSCSFNVNLEELKDPGGGFVDNLSASADEENKVSPFTSLVSPSSSSAITCQTPCSSSLLQKAASQRLTHPSKILPQPPECLEATLG